MFILFETTFFFYLPCKQIEICSTCSNSTSVDNVTRSVIRGVTSILMATGASDLKDKVYDLIRSTLHDSSDLRQFSSMNVTQITFFRTIGENQFIRSDSDTESDNNEAGNGNNLRKNHESGIVLVALSAAALSFVVTSIILYGLYRYQMKQKTGMDGNAEQYMTRIQAKRRHYFMQLEDDPPLAPGWMVTENSSALPETCQQPQHQSITWSVSDLTSDAESIIGSLPLDRIDEEDSKEMIAQEELPSPISSECTMESSLSDFGRSPVHIDHLQFIANFTENIPDVNAAFVAYPCTEEESKVEEPGLFDTIDEGSDSPLLLVVRPFWLEEDSMEIQDDVGEEEEEGTDSALDCRAITDDGGAEGDYEIEDGENSDDPGSTTQESLDDETTENSVEDYEIKANSVILQEFGTELSNGYVTVQENDDVKENSVNLREIVIAELKCENWRSAWPENLDNDMKRDGDGVVTPQSMKRFLKLLTDDSLEMIVPQTPLNDISNTVDEEAAEINECEANTVAEKAPDSGHSKTIASETDLSAWAKGVLTKLKANIQLITYEDW